MDARYRRGDHRTRLLRGHAGGGLLTVLMLAGCAAGPGLVAGRMPVAPRGVIESAPARQIVRDVMLAAIVKSPDVRFASHRAYTESLVLPVELVIYNAGTDRVVVHGGQITLELGDGSRYPPLTPVARRQHVEGDLDFVGFIDERMDGPPFPFTGAVLKAGPQLGIAGLAVLPLALTLDLALEGVEQAHKIATARRREQRRQREARLAEHEDVELGTADVIDLVLYFCPNGPGPRSRLEAKLAVSLSVSGAEAVVARLPITVPTNYALQMMGLSSRPSLDWPEPLVGGPIRKTPAIKLPGGPQGIP